MRIVNALTPSMLRYWLSTDPDAQVAIFTAPSDPPGCEPCPGVVTTIVEEGAAHHVIRVPWLLEDGELDQLAAGGIIWLSTWAGLPPHMLEVQAAEDTPPLDGAEQIRAERRRHLSEEGWTPEHDDDHDACELAVAAAGYIRHAVGQINGVCWPDEDQPDGTPAGWPWDPEWWKPSDDPRRNLIKAGALIAAELDRLQRKAAE